MAMDDRFMKSIGLEVPLVCGAMYPCSNPELVAAVSEAGGIGIIQPLSLTYVHGHEFTAGVKLIRTLTQKPVGLNVIVETSNATYKKRMQAYIDAALEQGIRFFVTSLGNPRWVVDQVQGSGGVVYHDVTEHKWAKKAVDGGVNGLIGVNGRAGGHAGHMDPRKLLESLAPLGLPVLCAGGVGTPEQFRELLDAGYAGVQMGTRFIASTECHAHQDYKEAIVAAHANDIVLTERISGVPVAVIRTAYVDAMGTRAGPIARALLKGRKTKHWMRNFYTLLSVYRLKRGLNRAQNSKDYWQAGQSVDGITSIVPAGDIVAACKAAMPPSTL
jgi:nitronate monooxygenase